MSLNIFEKCAKYTFDQHWKKVLLDCKDGKFPAGITYSIKDDKIIISSKTKAESITVFSEKNAVDIILFFKSHESQHPDNNCELSWKNIKKETKERMVSSYVAKFGKFNKLSSSEMKNMESVITLGLQFGTIGCDNIILDSDMNIMNIEGLDYDSCKKTFILPPLKLPTKEEKYISCKNTSNRYFTSIDKYVKLQNNRSFFHLG